MAIMSQSILSFGAATSLSVATTNLGVALRTSFFNSIIRQDMSKFETSKTGELTHQLTQDVAALQTAVRESFTRGVESVTGLVSGSILLFYVNSSMAIGMLTLLPVGAMAGSFLGEALRSLSAKSRDAANRATGIASESISNVRTVRAFAAEDRETARYKKELDEGSVLKTQMAMYSGAFYSCIGLGVNLTTLIIVGWGHQLVSAGQLTKGDIATIATQVQMLERSLSRLSVLTASLSKAMKNSQHIFSAIRSVPSQSNGKNIIPKDVRGRIQFQHVGFSYPSRPDKEVLHDVDFEAQPGDMIALVGASGAGKSTVAQLILRFYDPSLGSVMLDGVDIRDVDPFWLRREAIGFVQQEPALFSGTIAENIRYGNPNASMDQVMEAAKRANSHDFIMQFSQGYDTVLGERGVGLSGGQRARIAIARTLLLDPKVLVLDEPTSGLDAQSEYLVGKALDELMKGRTTVTIAHRLNTTVTATKIYCYEGGRIVESGTHEELLRKGPDGVYKAYWEKQNAKAKAKESH